SASPQARPDIHTTAVTPETVRALQHVAGNAAARRVRPVATAPEGPQRLWTDTEFKAKTYEGAFTQKSSAQVAVLELLKAYYALPTPKNKPTPAHANLLAQMKASAELWLADHTTELDGVTSEDPRRPKRLQGFKDFIGNIDGEMSTIRSILGDAATDVIGEEHKAYQKLRDHYKGSADSMFVKAA